MVIVDKNTNGQRRDHLNVSAAAMGSGGYPHMDEEQQEEDDDEEVDEEEDRDEYGDDFT
jgi:ribosomal protein L12E/L44/L45/RPP1/RPP2